MTNTYITPGEIPEVSRKVVLEGYFILDGATRELIWFGEVERYVSMEQVAMAHVAARANKSTVIEWYYDGISPLISECAPVKRQFDGTHGYRDSAIVAHTECCDIRFVQRVGPDKDLLMQIFDLVITNIADAELRDRTRSLFLLGVPLGSDVCGQLAQGFKAAFLNDGTIEIDARANRFSYSELISNADVYDEWPTQDLIDTESAPGV